MTQAIDLGAILRPGDQIIVGQAAGEPVELVRGLRAVAPSIADLSLFAGLSLSGLIDVELAAHVRIRSYAAMGTLAQVAAAGLLEIVPAHYADLAGDVGGGPDAVSRAVAFVQVSPADADGWHSFGVSQDFAAEAVSRADLVVAEVNARMPRVRGGVQVHSSRLAASIATDRPLAGTRAGEPSVAERAVGANVATLIPDGACVELGIGGIAAAVAEAVQTRRELRVHTALVGDWLIGLSRAGALAPSAPGRASVLTGAALGSPELYDFVGCSPAVEMGTIPQLSPIPVLASIPGLVAVNSALQVDLTGQVNAEVVGERYVGGLGGQLDFLRGAQLSEGGRAVIAMTSTASKGTVTRIVNSLDAGWVTTPRSCVDYVVTEFGVAELAGASFAERGRRLIEIAHPDFRSLLSDELNSSATYRNPRRQSHVNT